MDLKQAAKEQVEKAKEFNRRPPWWATLLVIVLVAIVVKALFVLSK